MILVQGPMLINCIVPNTLLESVLCPPPWTPGGILENLGGLGGILEFGRFFLEARGALRKREACLKWVRSKSA